ncbi:response regulator transcription factor [Kibdelosporangium persicum]|uniref:response regulator transcription factor n=1 Tax=Kibdelosporangium persicum TaxID=2698649 RepID=UPI0015665A06|nr:response regulator transcription factor [Kibdelosporangium persicum]
MTFPGAKTEILVCSPHPVIREGLVSIIDRDPVLTVAGDAGTGDALVELARTLRPSIVVTAHVPPALDAMRISAALGRGTDPRGRPRVVALVGDLDHRELLEMIQAGVRGIVLEDMISSELTSALRTVASGLMVLGVPAIDSTFQQILIHMPSDVRGLAEEFRMLTKRELEVLAHVARGKSNRRIAADLCVSEATVKSHLYHMCRKLNVTDRAQMVVMAYEFGLVSPAKAAAC